jgi:hypothetical protein
MGYYIFSYAIDLAKVKGVIGTTDKGLFDAVVGTEEFDLYAGQEQQGYTTTRAALEQLVLGKRHSLFSKYDKASAHAYWYAFIAIFGLPEVQDWPLCGVWDREQLTVQQDRFSAIDITDEQLQELAESDDEKEMAYDSIRQIKENVTYCLEKQLCMITFCH